MLLLQTNNNKWYWIAAIPMILSDLPGFSHIASLCKWVFFIQLCSNWKSKLCGSWRLWALLVLLQWPFTPCYGQIHRIMIFDMTSLVRVKSYNSVFSILELTVPLHLVVNWPIFTIYLRWYVKSRFTLIPCITKVHRNSITTNQQMPACKEKCLGWISFYIGCLTWIHTASCILRMSLQNAVKIIISDVVICTIDGMHATINIPFNMILNTRASLTHTTAHGIFTCAQKLTGGPA